MGYNLAVAAHGQYAKYFPMTRNDQLSYNRGLDKLGKTINRDIDDIKNYYTAAELSDEDLNGTIAEVKIRLKSIQINSSDFRNGTTEQLNATKFVAEQELKRRGVI